MTAKANSFGQRTFDFIEGLDRLDTPEAVLDTMLRVVSRFGSEWLAFSGILPKPGETLDDLILAHHSPDDCTTFTPLGTMCASIRTCAARCVPPLPSIGPGKTMATSTGLARPR